MEASRLAALAPLERAQKLSAQAKDYLDRGLLLEAERLYQAAVAADGNGRRGARRPGRGARTHRRRRCARARKRTTALELMPSADAYLVLGRLDLAANHLVDAQQKPAER